MQDANPEQIESIVPLPEEFRNWKEERQFRRIAVRPSSSGPLKYQRAPICGHKVILEREPRHRNCQSCWFIFFNAHKELVEACDEVFKNFGEDGLKQIRPGKFTTNYLRFMSTVASWKKAADAAKETHGNETKADL